MGFKSTDEEDFFLIFTAYCCLWNNFLSMILSTVIIINVINKMGTMYDTIEITISILF